MASAVLLLAPALPAAAQAIRPEMEHGHIVWTNDSFSAAAARHSAHLARHAPRYFYYWSNARRRWMPVKAASPGAIRSAHAVAGEVASYIHSRPRLRRGDAPPRGKLASQDPNYAEAAGGSSVSAAEIDRYIREASARQHVDPNLVRAVIKVESNFNPHAVSRKGAMGLMQLMPATARMYDVRNPFDARQNVDAGVRHLRGLLDNFQGNVPLTLAAYNAGAGAVERSGGIPPYPETRRYVRRITALMGNRAVLHAASVAPPVHMHRDDHGILVITNTD